MATDKYLLSVQNFKIIKKKGETNDAVSVDITICGGYS